MVSTKKYIENILLTKVIAFGLPFLKRLKTKMQDRKQPRKQGNSREYVICVIGIIICQRSLFLRRTEEDWQRESQAHEVQYEERERVDNYQEQLLGA